LRREIVTPPQPPLNQRSSAAQASACVPTTKCLQGTASQAAEKGDSGKVLVAQPLLAVRFSGLTRIQDAINPSRKSHSQEWLCYFFRSLFSR